MYTRMLIRIYAYLMVGGFTKAVKFIYTKSRYQFKLLIGIIPSNFLPHEVGSIINSNSLEKNLGHREVKRDSSPGRLSL